MSLLTVFPMDPSYLRLPLFTRACRRFFAGGTGAAALAPDEAEAAIRPDIEDIITQAIRGQNGPVVLPVIWKVQQQRLHWKKVPNTKAMQATLLSTD